ncbi:MBL fold metallo-hydrolase [Hydrogenophaga sp. UC242_53]|uniref:MBL fold metallo-hydrolase n=1 Tax=Hydrogenophaga sp. UC242_53 TaxID=3350170 RepID=UPI0036D3ECF1
MRAVGALLFALCVSVNAQGRDCPDGVPWQPVAPGVWAWSPPAPQEISPDNAGHVVPTSVLIDGGEALVVDPGPSHRHGERVRASLACRFGVQVRWIVNTHAHAENVLANGAWADRIETGQTTVLATEGTRRAMEQRCPACLQSLIERAGAQAMAGTAIVWPTRGLIEGAVLAVGAQRLRVMRVEQGHTESDLVLWHAQQGVLWAGGLVYGERLPELAQGSVDGWLAALDRLQALGPRHVIGAVVSSAQGDSGPVALSGTRGYLQALRDHVLSAMDQGRHAGESATVPMPEWRGWAGHAQRQDFNVQRAWRELEPLWMRQAPPPASAEQVGR